MTEKRLREARREADSYIGMYADYGGIPLLTCPVRMIKCNERKLYQLFKIIVEKSDRPSLTEGVTINYYSVTYDRGFAHMRKFMRDTGWRGDAAMDIIEPSLKNIPGLEKKIKTFLAKK